MEHHARRAVTIIRQNYHEPLVLDDLARSVMVSKFYLIRVFQRATGVTPGRFLSAVRLHEAKSLLVHSSLNVAEISARVGYSSPSTFSRRFTTSVGVSPTQYRRIGRHDTDEDPGIAPSPVERGPLGSVAGTAHVLGTSRSPLYIGLFDSPILQGQPAAWTKLDGTGPFRVKNVPPGTWHLHAVTLGARTSAEQWGDSPLLVGTVGPVDICAGARTRIDVVLQQEDWTRPPVLLALPGIGSRPGRPVRSRGRLPHPAAAFYGPQPIRRSGRPACRGAE
ncbi:helix-turn-helix domain-containing protein [Kitasatospora sp. NPDC088351]|uniref:helix-turn-helix domain-containing protein n=1 Tax=unclassified Kitasatospora TaxID=2633591 RepID=UPI003429946B